MSIKWVRAILNEWPFPGCAQLRSWGVWGHPYVGVRAGGCSSSQKAAREQALTTSRRHMHLNTAANTCAHGRKYMRTRQPIRASSDHHPSLSRRCIWTLQPILMHTVANTHVHGSQYSWTQLNSVDFSNPIIVTTVSEVKCSSSRTDLALHYRQSQPTTSECSSYPCAVS